MFKIIRQPRIFPFFPLICLSVFEFSPLLNLSDLRERDFIHTNIPKLCLDPRKETIIPSNNKQLALPIVEDCLQAASISWEFIDKIIYINAVGSIDRNEAMLSNFLPVFQKNNEDIIRFEAITNKSLTHPQRVGRSHYNALQLALDMGFKNVLILEDDVLWRVSSNRSNLLLLESLAKNVYDVILLGGTSVVTDVNHRVSFSQTTSSYLVFGEYIPTLLDNIREGLEFLEHRKEDIYIIDLYWQKLMKQDLWFIIRPSLVIQNSYPVAFGYSYNGTR
jgi:hypothetical protein